MDFEAHTISDNDFHGIKTLLQQVQRHSCLHCTEHRLTYTAQLELQQRLRSAKIMSTISVYYIFPHIYVFVFPAVPEVSRKHI